MSISSRFASYVFVPPLFHIVAIVICVCVFFFSLSPIYNATQHFYKNVTIFRWFCGSTYLFILSSFINCKQFVWFVFVLSEMALMLARQIPCTVHNEHNRDGMNGDCEKWVFCVCIVFVLNLVLLLLTSSCDCCHNRYLFFRFLWPNQKQQKQIKEGDFINR